MKKGKTMKVLAVQHVHGRPPKIAIFLQEKYRDADFICFPEYFMGIQSERARTYLKKLSMRVHALVLGTFIENEPGNRVNLTYIYHRGKVIDRYVKHNPTLRERVAGIRPGRGLKTFKWKGVRFGILICNDVLKGTRPDQKEPQFNPVVFRKLKKKKVDLIFVPLISPLRRSDTPRKVLGRRKILGKMAETARAYLIKVGGVGRLVGEPVQGRSGAYDPSGNLIAQARSENGEEILIITMDL